MTNYTKTMMESLAEVRDLQENNMVLMRKAAGQGGMQTLKMKDGKLKMDKVTASAMMQIYDKLNPANQKKMEQMINNGKKSGIIKVADFAMSKVTGFKSEDIDLDEGKEKSARQLVDPNREVMVVKKNKVVVIDQKDQDKYLKQGWSLAEETELDEAPKYELYHKDFSSAMQHAYKMAKKLHGITVKPSEIDDKVASGPRKPSEGKTNSYRLEGDKGAIQVQVYNKGGSKPYELNFYKEEVELDEGTAQVRAHSGKGQYKVVKDGDITKVMYKGKEISSGDFDRGADGWFMNIKGEKGQKFFDDVQKMADYFAKNKITEQVAEQLSKIKGNTPIDEAVSDVQAMKAKYTLIKVAKKGERKSQSFWNNLLKVANSGPQGTIITADDLKRVDDHSNKLKRDVRLSKKNKREEVEPDGGIARIQAYNLEEGRMKELHGYIEDGKSAEWIAKKMGVDVKTIKALMDETIKEYTFKEYWELGTNEYRAYLEKVTPGEVDEASARADAKRAMKSDPSMEQDPFSKDDEASPEDVKGASKNIIMQMRNAVNQQRRARVKTKANPNPYKGKVEFNDKKKIEIPVKVAQAVLDKYDSFKKPADKAKFQAQVGKSYKDMLKVLKAGYYEEVEIDEALPGKWPAPGVKKGTRKDLEKLEKELRAAKKKKDKEKAAALQKELERLMKSGKGKKIGPAWMHKEETILDRIDRKLKERKNG